MSHLILPHDSFLQLRYCNFYSAGHGKLDVAEF
jgi:hypothetical protein